MTPRRERLQKHVRRQLHASTVRLCRIAGEHITPGKSVLYMASLCGGFLGMLITITNPSEYNPWPEPGNDQPKAEAGQRPGSAYKADRPQRPVNPQPVSRRNPANIPTFNSGGGFTLPRDMVSLSPTPSVSEKSDETMPPTGRPPQPSARPTSEAPEAPPVNETPTPRPTDSIPPGAGGPSDPTTPPVDVSPTPSMSPTPELQHSTEMPPIPEPSLSPSTTTFASNVQPIAEFIVVFQR